MAPSEAWRGASSRIQPVVGCGVLTCAAPEDVATQLEFVTQLISASECGTHYLERSLRQCRCLPRCHRSVLTPSTPSLQVCRMPWPPSSNARKCSRFNGRPQGHRNNFSPPRSTCLRPPCSSAEPAVLLMGRKGRVRGRGDVPTTLWVGVAGLKWLPPLETRRSTKIPHHPQDVADREGFEPSVPVKVHTISNRARSTTLASVLGKVAKGSMRVLAPAGK